MSARDAEYTSTWRPGCRRCAGWPRCCATTGSARTTGTHWTHKVIGGYRVLVASPRTKRFHRPGQWLCAKDADGLWVGIVVYGKNPVLGVTGLFAHHLRLLGPDPAHWTRNPIG
jgi:hypothetical protein